MFTYDWFHGSAYQQQWEEARVRCTQKRFPDDDPQTLHQKPEAVEFHDDLVLRTLIYLRDGFSYEVKEMAQVDSKTHLTFECEPVDEHYKVGAFVVCVPFDEIVRVEVFAVHRSEKPEDMPLITGFRGKPEGGEAPARDK